MKKQLPLLIVFLLAAFGGWTQVVTTASSVTICTGPATVQIPVKVSAFTAVGSISLKLAYVNSEISSPTIVYKDPGLTTWGTFLANTSTPGTIIISAYDPDVTPPIDGLTLANNTILFTLQFNIGTITTPAVLSFVENTQGTWCEYGGIGPNYTPFVDTPASTYYINGSVTIVADPVAPALTKSPSDGTVCAGQTLTVTTSPGSGGTGTITDEYSYSTNSGTSWSGWTVSVPSFAAVTGTNLIRSRRTANGTGCDESSFNSVSWTVVADPIAPGLTKNPVDATVCSGTTLTVTTSPGSGGSGTIADEYSYSTNNGSSWSNWSASVPSFAAVTGTNLVRSRRTATGTGCDESAFNSVSWTVVADPVAPGLTRSPVDATVCAGTTLTVTTSAGSGGTGTITDEYQYSTDNGATWSSWSTSVPSFAAVVGTNKIQSRRTASGTGCNESTYNSVSWTVVADPVAPGLTKSPIDATVCAGTNLTVTISAGSGGTGTITDEYQYSTDNGGTWSSWSTSVPSFAAVAGTNKIQSRRTATGTGCDTSPLNTVSWTVVADPVAPGLTKNPVDATVCAATTLTVTTSSGSGGTGAIADEYQYSTDHGTTWSSWSTSAPSFAAVVGTNKIQSRRTATGTGCDTSPLNTVSWTVVADPVAPGLTKNPVDASVCAGSTLTVTTSSGSGGTGTINDQYQYSTDNGASWSGWSTSVPSFAAVTGTNLVQSRRTASGTGCDTSPVNTVSWTVVADPVAPGITKNPADANVCSGQTLTVTTSAGSGGAGTTADEYRYSSDNGGTWSSWGESVPSFAAVVGISKIQSRRTASGTGCDVSSINEVSWTVVADPIAPGITKNPVDASVCAGVTLTVSSIPGSGGTGTINDQYQYSTDNGSSWSGWSTSVPSFAAVAGTNKIQSRRTATGTGCDISSVNEVSWVVNAKQKITGTFNYYNVSGNILLTGADITVDLYKSSDASHTSLIATDVTDASGYYELNAICPDCDYDIVASSTHTTDGAINTTDAAQANYWGPNPYSIEKVRFHAGDVAGQDLFIGGTDAGLIQANFVNGTDFEAPDWTYWRAGFAILHNPLVAEPEYTEYFPKVTLAVGSDINANMYGLATGDFNRSFNPSLTKAASSTLLLVYDGNRQVGAGQEFDLPVRIVNEAMVGAVSLVLDFPSDLVEVKDVIVDGNTGSLQWAAKGNELRISWLSPEPLVLAASDELVVIRMKTKPGFTSGKSIRVSLASTPQNELTDELYNVISDALISVETIDASALGTGEPDLASTIGFTCYPNPSRNFTLFSYSLPYEGFVKLEITNLMGYQIETLVNESQDTGDHYYKFDTYSLPNGIYTATLKLKSKDNQSVMSIKLINNK